MGWARGWHVIGVLIFLLVVLTALIVNHVGRSALRRRGIRVNATCVRQFRDSSGKYQILMEFAGSDGAIIRRKLRIHYSEPPLVTGDVVEIMYDPKDRASPSFATDAYAGKWAPLLIGVVGFLVVLVVLSLTR